MWDVRGFRIAVRDAGLALRWDHTGQFWSTSVEPIVNDAILVVQAVRNSELPNEFVAALKFLLSERDALQAAILLGGALAAIDFARGLFDAQGAPPEVLECSKSSSSC